MIMTKRYTILLMAMLTAAVVMARENEGEQRRGNHQSPTANKLMKYAADCEPATAQADLDINNVRTKILNGGDMWWDLNTARYEIPKINDVNQVRKHSMFAGALWIGGRDKGGNLKLAAMTYRQRGSDFWPGPLDKNTGTTNTARCLAYDQIYQVTRDEIIEHYENWQDAANTGGYNVDNENIRNWPGNAKQPGDPENLAPYFDNNQNGTYDPINGDYPILWSDCRGVEVPREQNTPDNQPDKMLWFIYNDRGNIHSETQGQPIGLELQTTAFAFATQDEINNMTFYTTRIINRSLEELDGTYFGQWVDPDLGNYQDDYVGCDVGLSLGFCYNGDDNDEGILGYGLNPPSVGVDFFQGPIRDTVINGIDSSIELGMSKFVYYNNNFDPVNGNPRIAVDYYNYLQGRWMNGDCIKRGADGRTGTQCANYMFPFTSDPAFPGDDWNERQSGNAPADRRFLQSSGPFTLLPGAVNRVTVGVVWARTTTGGAEGSLTLLKEADRKAQELFNNCFDIKDGPDAPDVTVQELDREIILQFSGYNDIEKHEEIVVDADGKVQTYRFQGYRVYQLKDASVGTGDLDNVDKAKEIFQCDKKDSIITLVNNYFDGDLRQSIPRLMVSGNNEGVVRTLSIKTDEFSTRDDNSLVNNRNYYFMVISYAALPGHPEEEYLAGRKITTVRATPRLPEPRMGGVQLQAGYGDGPSIVRLEGTGNGGNVLDLTEESINEILQNGSVTQPQYVKGRGPVNVKVIDPLKVPEGEFEITLLEDPIPSSTRVRDSGVVAENTRWILVKLPNDTIYSDTSINYPTEQLFIKSTTGSDSKDWGLALTMEQVPLPGDVNDQTGGLLEWTVEWENIANQWLTGIPDLDNNAGLPWWNWIRSGTFGKTEGTKDFSVHDYFIGLDGMDAFEVYEKIWDGRAAPYRLASKNPTSATPQRPARLVQGVAFSGGATTPDWSLANLQSIDLVITPDKSKWTKCVVVELGEDPILNEGNVDKFRMRDHASFNLDGTYSNTETGRSWFPGYAINVETGERLNLILGEDSYQSAENGRDMKWNPTDNGSFYSNGYPSWGGRHFVYVMGSYEGRIPNLFPKGPIYDEGAYYHQIFTTIKDRPVATQSIEIANKIMYQCMWVFPFYLGNGFDMEEDANGVPMPVDEVKFRIRVARPYKYKQTVSNSGNDDNPRYRFSSNDIAAKQGEQFGKDAMELINVVPNPYYARAHGSGYETSTIDNRVKFTNLPERCEISIYTLDGQLVRRLKKDDEASHLDWDLKNQARVPIASGFYIIHVNGFDLGEKVLKWYGIMRELDLDSF